MSDMEEVKAYKAGYSKGYNDALREHAKDEEHIKKLSTLLHAMWVRIEAEYPNGGFPDRSMFEDELLYLGVITKNDD